jgi:hypothetical protein
VAGYPDAFDPFLQKAGFINDQNALRVGHVFLNLAEQVVAHGVRPTVRPGLTGLHVVGGALPERFGGSTAVAPSAPNIRISVFHPVSTDSRLVRAGIFPNRVMALLRQGLTVLT